MKNRTRNTDLQIARGYGKTNPDGELNRLYEREPALRQMHVSGALMNHSPLRTRNWGGQLGWSEFQLTADGRSYTVLTLADDAVEWTMHGALTLRSFIEEKLTDIEAQMPSEVDA